MRYVVYGVAAVLFSIFSLFAGTTGKIAGRVVDAHTKEPLAGANVYLKGTNFGASTDTDGDYYIINVPVGTYTIVVTYVGYRTIEHPGVKVIMDQTTKVNFQMTEEIAEGETIVVTATPFKVQKDETAKKITIQAEDIQSMPVTDFSEMVTAQAGVIQMESSVQGIAGFEDRGIEEIHVRGGRSGEIGYTIDGTYIVNPFYGSKYSGTELNDFAIEQVDIKTGVFDAEYGGALSSMINIITRDGGEKLEGNLRLMSSNPANLGNLFSYSVDPLSRPNLAFQRQDYLRDYREISGGIGGPIPWTHKRVRFIVTGHRMGSAYRVYEFDHLTYDRSQPQDSEHNQFLNRLDTIAGWHQMGFRHSWDIYGKLTWKISNSMKFAFSNWIIENIFRTANLANYPYQYYEQGRNIDRQRSDRQSIMFNHQLSKKTFYNINMSRFFQRMDIFETDDGTIGGRHLTPDEYERPGFDDDYEHNPYLFEYYIKGHDRYYHHSYSETYEVVASLLSQVTKHHQIKTGVDYRQHYIMMNEIQLPWLNIPYVEKYPKPRHPEELSFYVQDLLEYDYMTIHLGMRVDMLNAHAKYWKDPWAVEKELVNSKWETRWSPRISFSHVITDNATFTFGYGQFTQTPAYRNKYINPNRDIKTYSPIVGNAGLNMEHMTAYEFGINVGISDNVITQVIGWSKEYSQLTSTERIPQFPYSYTILLNTDYATARGVDVVIRRRGENSNMVLQYTLSRATANRKDPWEGYRQTQTPRTMPKREILMSYDRTHDISLMYSYHFNDKQGPVLFGKHFMEHSRFDLMFLAISGFPYTPVIGNVAGETNSERSPWNLTVNFNFRKFIDIGGGMKMILGLRVQNLFDWKNPIDIYPETGKADDPGPRINQLIEMGWFSRTLWDQPYRYGRRRQVDFSLEFAF